MNEYVTSPVKPHPHVVHLDEQGTTLILDDSTLPVDDSTLPEGSTLVLTSDPEVVEKAPTQPLTREQFLGIISRMLKNEEITPTQALEMRRRFGITNASFHKAKVNKAKKKKARALAYKNRRTNRLNGSTKGQTKQINRSK